VIVTDRRAFDLDHELSRRKFLAGLGLAGTVVAGTYAVDTWARPLAAGAAANAPKQSGKKRHTVVFVELAGGNDGIGMVIPYTDPNYRRLRPTLAVDNPLDLDGAVGLHPSLVKLADRYRAGQVAIVEGIGYPNNDLSHFASLANWWSGTPGHGSSTGWLGRYLDQTVGFSDPLAGVVIGPGPSPALLGERSFATSISDATGLQPDAPTWIRNPGTLADTWAKFAPRRADRSTLLGQVQAAVGLTSDARAELARTLSAAPATGGDGSTSSPAATAYADGSAVASLDLAARLVAAKEPPKVVYVTNLGDYDTHQGQAARQQALFEDLDGGLERFFTSVEAAGVADKVIVVTLSEFGRRAQENGSGTDHGAASAHFVIGSKVKGGRYGQPTALGTLDARGNLPMAVDFRQVYATALEGWLGVDAEPILGRGYEPQAVFT
jgi:uncharacterized protein (DUF1501 family)